jgi:vacuolar iron transporter family protein
MSLAANPEAAEYNEAQSREVLSLSYQIRGLPAKEANRFVDQLANDKSQFVSALAQERLNMMEEGLRKPWNQLFPEPFRRPWRFCSDCSVFLS